MKQLPNCSLMLAVCLRLSMLWPQHHMLLPCTALRSICCHETLLTRAGYSNVPAYGGRPQMCATGSMLGMSPPAAAVQAEAACPETPPQPCRPVCHPLTHPWGCRSGALTLIPAPTPRWPDLLCAYSRPHRMMFTSKLFCAHVSQTAIAQGALADEGGWDVYGRDWQHYFDCMLAPVARQASSTALLAGLMFRTCRCRL